VDLDGRVAIVTGAGRGLGREHALLLAAHGARVVVNDRGGSTSGEGTDGSVAQEVVDEITAAGGVAVANGDSVSDFAGAKRLVDTALEAFDRLDVVINNAGILRDKMLVNMSEEEFDSVVAVHLKGTFCVTRHAAEHWRSEHKAGRPVQASVVTTSSGAALFNNVGQTNYAAAKAGIAAFSMVAAKELAPYGVRVNSIAPMARTRLVEQTPGMSELVQQTRDAVFDPWAPSNISPLVVYLASPRCPHTGGIWHVFGGRIDLVGGYTLEQGVERRASWTPEELEAELGSVLRPRPGEVLSEVLSLEEVTQLVLDGQIAG
jgi:NAD(P)-dependent dehydrogenase (short-subunit alcohol dehydrogenase family)